MTSKAQSSLRKGFTLIEVMVSTAIMIVIVLAVVTIASDTFKAYDKAVADLTSQSEARGVLDALENDFQTAVIRPDGKCWMEVIIPGSTKAPSGTSKFGDIDKSDQPIILLFSSPSDRPRYSADTSPVALKGDTCAVAYRFGQASPFASPGERISQVYGVYRTIIDSENTFKEAIPVILRGFPVTTTKDIGPWEYWNGNNGTQSYNDYSSSPQKKVTNGTLLDFNLNTKKPCWTLDSSNLIGANVVSMNLIFWCSSTLPDTVLTGTGIADPLKRTAQTLRPLVPVGIDNNRNSAAVIDTLFSKSVIQYASTGVTPSEQFTSRLRIFKDRIYPDDKSNIETQKLVANSSSSQATILKSYLPYTLKAVEVSITVLTPEGSKELRSYQDMFSAGQNNTGVSLKDSAEFKRIVTQYGKNFTRYIRLLGNGG